MSNSKIIDYKMVCGNVDIDIQIKINNLLKEGWELYGTPFSSRAFYNQAMVLKEYYPPANMGPR